MVTSRQKSFEGGGCRLPADFYPLKKIKAHITADYYILIFFTKMK